jgi:hypothetical protein
MVLFETFAYGFIWSCEGAYSSGRASNCFRDQRGIDAHPRTRPSCGSSQIATIDSRRVESAFDSQLRRWFVFFYIESLQVFPNCKSY